MESNNFEEMKGRNTTVVASGKKADNYHCL